MIHSIGVISKPKKEDICAVVPQLLDWAKKHKLQVLYDQETAECIAAESHSIPREEIVDKVDMILVLGGDGTLLATARLMDGHQVPILPVNLGGLGFLTSVTLDELYPILETVLKGQHRISDRILLQAEVIRAGKVVHSTRALNDAVLNKAAMARITDFDLYIDDGYVCSYKGDGLIISTPTGSTAYSLAAGGPILYPILGAFVITPICPHTLTDRPLVVPDSAQLRVEFHESNESVFLTLDGQVGHELQGGDVVALRKADHPLRLVRPTRKTYFEILRSKLKWGAR